VFERIVAAIDNDPDRSGRVVDAARELAEAFKSDVLVAHVRDLERPAAMVVSTARGGATQPAVHLESEEQARQLVEAAVERLRAAGLAADGEVGPGVRSKARELLEIASSFDATTIVIGDRGSHVTDVLLGSVAHKVVHLAEVPVLLVR
jgi:nucleotide-binding universal stress UspA family protein